MSRGQNDWGEGYVTDVAYTPGYYLHQSPLHLQLACLLGGVAGIDINPETPLSYLELGCGLGFGALVLAASNPAWRVTGIDFLPAHIAMARELAAEAGIANASFIEADLATLANDPLAHDIPPADVATMHGLWSWVADPVRDGIITLLGSKVRPGGVVQVSYNSLPGWQSALGLQRVMREAGQRLATRSDLQATKGAEIVTALADAKAVHLQGGFLKRLLEHFGPRDSSYLAHEYMTATWRPCFHADVVASLAAAKLSWVASAHLLENFPSLMLDEEVRGIVERFDDAVMQELIKDMCINRSLRQDVFVRGARRLSDAERDRALSDVMLALVRSPEKVEWTVGVPSGQANLERTFFGPIVERLARGPCRVGDLMHLPGLERRGSPAEIIGMLVGSNQAMRVLAPGTEPDLCVRRLNAAAARRFVRPDNLGRGMALASSGSGTPLSCPMLDLFVASRLQENQPCDAEAWAGELGAGQPEAERQRLREFIDMLVTERTPAWRHVGVLPPASSV